MKHIAVVLFCIALLFSCKDDEPSTPELPEVDADFSASEATIEEGSSVTFTDQSTGNPTSWNWTFEGGEPATSTSKNPTVSYPAAGTYQVTLSASNDDNEDTETKSGYITVFAAIEAEFSASDSVIAVGQSVTFTDESLGEPSSWEWTFQGGEPSTATQQNPTVSYAAPGIYSVSLTAADDNSSDTDEKPDFIRVFELITAGFSANDTIITEGESVQFSDESTGRPTQWEWSFEGGTPSSSTEQNPTISYDAPGTFMVTLTASNDDTTATDTKATYITVEEQVALTVPTAGLELWLRADSAVTLDAENRVESWSDISGYGHTATQTQENKRPQLIEGVLNGNPVLRLDGTDDYLTFGNILNEVFVGPDKQFTLFVVMKSMSREQGTILIKSADTSFPVWRNERQLGFGIFEGEQTMFVYFDLDNSPRRIRRYNSEMQVLDTTRVFTYQYDGFQDGNDGLDRVDFFLDGEEVQTTLRINIGTLGNIQEGPAQLAIGARVSADGEAGPEALFKGDVAEMLLYSRLPSEDERVAIETYLRSKYGISP